MRSSRDESGTASAGFGCVRRSTRLIRPMRATEQRGDVPRS